MGSWQIGHSSSSVCVGPLVNLIEAGSLWGFEEVAGVEGMSDERYHQLDVVLVVMRVDEEGW